MIRKSSGFDALRLIAAAMVIFGHSYPLTGHVGPGVLGNGVHAIGVKIFFVISGFLIARSWRSDPSLFRFWCKRALRLMPGLIAVCLVSALIAGPLLTELSVAAYFRDPGTLFYLWNIALYPVFALPGVFIKNIYPVAVNGSLWTLPIEVAMYSGVPFLIGRYRRSAAILIPAVACALLAGSIFFVFVAKPQKPPVFWGTSPIAALDLAYYFYAGASVAVLRLEKRCNVAVAAAIFIGAAWIVANPIAAELALAATLPCLVIGLGQSEAVPARKLDGHDISYGLYLYGFPVQQILVQSIGAQAPLFNFAVALPVTAVLATLSWRLVERPALAMKPGQHE